MTLATRRAPFRSIRSGRVHGDDSPRRHVTRICKKTHPSDDLLCGQLDLPERRMPNWQEILSRDGGAVWQTAYRYLGNRADADECFQEAFLAAFELSRRQEVKNWRALLKHLAAARAVDRLRRRRHQARRHQVPDWDSLPDQGPTPSQIAEDAELTERLRTALARLPPNRPRRSAFTVWRVSATRRSRSTWPFQSTPSACFCTAHAIASASSSASRHSSCRTPLNVIEMPARAGVRTKGAVVSTRPQSPSPDHPLARAEAAFLRASVPDGPAPEVVARTLEALAAKTQQQANPWIRRKAVLVTMKIAAAALVAAGVLAYFALFPSTEATAFAVMAQKLREAHSVSYTGTTESADLKTPLKMKFLFKEPNLFRTEVPGGIVTIVDTSQGKQLILDPAAKTALVLEGKPAAVPAGPGAGGGLIAHLRQLTEGDAKPAGEKAIGGIQARGYLINNLGMQMTIWVDPATRLPIRLESSDRSQGKEIHFTASEFQIDPEMNEALFRTDPPAGYSVRKGASDAIGMDDKTFLNPEKAVEAFLRTFAAKTGGTFPNRLDASMDFDKAFPKNMVGMLPDPETLQAVQAFTRVLMATRSLKGGFVYKPDGVKLGDAAKILFWYRPEGAAHYRAIYGDLHSADVTEDKLPEKPKP